MPTYNNIPQKTTTDSALGTIKLFNQYGQTTVSLDAASIDACEGFFESKGFGKDASKSIAYIILKQAKLDGYNPFQVLDSLAGMDTIQISALVTEILNYNRFKTSTLGMSQTFTPVAEIERNILA
jgi:hypothetical protein